MESVFIIRSFCIFLLLSVFICVHPWFHSFSVPPSSSRAEAGEDCQGGFFGALAALADRADAGGAAVFAGACGDQFARFREQDLCARYSGSENPMPPG